MIKPFRDPRNNNYLRYNLYINSNEVIKMSVSRLVALHFLNRIDGKDIVYFKDGNCENCSVSNISWGDRNDVIYNTFLINSIDKKDYKCNEIFGKEKWKAIKDDKLMYDYEISNYGRVYNSTNHTFVSQSGGYKNTNNQSYMAVSLRQKDKTYVKFMVHRLVGIYFVKGFSKERCFINHINGNPEFNYYKNLEWVTSLENLIHAIKTNLLHTSSFKSDKSDPEWRTKIVVSWILSSVKKNIMDAFEIYIRYRNMYENNILEFSFDEFESFVNEKLSTDDDFIKIYNFYMSKYDKI